MTRAEGIGPNVTWVPYGGTNGEDYLAARVGGQLVHRNGKGWYRAGGSDGSVNVTVTEDELTLIRRCAPNHDIWPEHFELAGYGPPPEEQPPLDAYPEQMAGLEATGWEKVDLRPWLYGTPPDDRPTLASRADGQPILYPGKVHAFNGEPESGKSWCAQHICAQLLQSHQDVTYLDFEDGPGSVVARLLALGVDPLEVGGYFHYHRLDQPFTLEAAVVLDQALAYSPPTIVVLDGMTEAMGLCGLDPYNNPDVAKFWAQIPRRAVRTGAAVILIDHVVKDGETRGRWAIGAQHKMAAIDGAAFTIQAVKPFGRGIEGKAKLIITKDRPGHLRSHAAGQTIAEFTLTSWPDDKVTATLEAPAATGDSFEPTVLMERVSRYVELNPAMSKRAIREAVKGDNNAIDLALELLVNRGHITTEDGPRRAVLHHPTNPYREHPTTTDNNDDI